MPVPGRQRACWKSTALPGSKPVTEGIRLSVLTFKFVQESGATLFHVLQDQVVLLTGRV